MARILIVDHHRFWVNSKTVFRCELAGGRSESRFFPGEDKETERMERKTGLLNKDYPVLVVDDEPMVLSVLAKMLGKLGYPVETALGSEEAIGRLTGSAFHLVITDFNMPTLNGQQLAGWIKQHHPHTKVVIMTGCSSDVARRLRTGCDIDAVMFKPIGLKELRDVISGLNLSRAFPPGSVSPSISLKTHPDSISSGPLSGSNPDHPLLHGELNER